MVVLLSLGSWEVRKKANTRNLLHFHVSCTRAHLACANLFKYCSRKFHLRCCWGAGRSCGLCCLCTDPAAWRALLQEPRHQHSSSLIRLFSSHFRTFHLFYPFSYPFLEQSAPISEWRYPSVPCYASCYLKSVMLTERYIKLSAIFWGRNHWYNFQNLEAFLNFKAENFNILKH